MDGRRILLAREGSVRQKYAAVTRNPPLRLDRRSCGGGGFGGLERSHGLGEDPMGWDTLPSRETRPYGLQSIIENEGVWNADGHDHPHSIIRQVIGLWPERE